MKIPSRHQMTDGYGHVVVGTITKVEDTGSTETHANYSVTFVPDPEYRDVLLFQWGRPD